MKNHLTTLNLRKLYILADLQKELKYKELCKFLNIGIKTGDAKKKSIRTACGDM